VPWLALWFLKSRFSAATYSSAIPSTITWLYAYQEVTDPGIFLELKLRNPSLRTIVIGLRTQNIENRLLRKYFSLINIPIFTLLCSKHGVINKTDWFSTRNKLIIVSFHDVQLKNTGCSTLNLFSVWNILLLESFSVLGHFMQNTCCTGDPPV
jgi:hypothetical protein